MKTPFVQQLLSRSLLALMCAGIPFTGALIAAPPAGDQFSQQQQLTAADGAAFDQFGAAVAISNDTAVVGSPYDTVGANTHQGSVYVFVRSGNTWTQQAQLFANDGAAGDEFGWSVAIDGDTIVVGADADDVFANTDQGSAYVFTRSGTTWAQQAHLFANDGSARDRDYFGNAVAVQGNTAIVGAYLNDSFNVNQGSAYVFVRSGTAWSLQQHLFAADGTTADEFGSSVALDGDTAVVGAWSDSIGANFQQGSAYVFVRVGTTWSQQAKLTAVDGQAQDFFGVSVSISSDTVVAGSDWHDIGGNNNQGAAYIFVRSGTTWSQQQQLIASDGAANDEFGHSVAIIANMAVVGAWMDDVVSAVDQGSAYVFTRSGTAWTEQQQLAGTDSTAGDQFGTSVALSGSTLIAGAWADDIGANTDQGRAAIFTQLAATVTGAVSRKAHGGAGNFDIPLPLTGTPGVECRTTEGTTDYTMVLTFSGNVTVTGSPEAELTVGTGCVGSGGTCTGNVTVSGNTVTVPLTNIANAQTINVRINGVNNAADAPATDFIIPMSILIGDTNANGTVNAADVAQTKSRLGQTVDATNFRSDLNANGSINAADTAVIKQNSGSSLPP